MKKNITNSKLLTIRQAALFLGVNSSTIRKWAIGKKLTGIKVGSRGDWRFTRESLEELVNKNGTGPLKKNSRTALPGNVTKQLYALYKKSVEAEKTEEALRLSMEQLQALLDHTPMGVYLVDANFCIQEVNPIALQVFGDIPNLIGRNFDEVIHQLWSKEYADEVVRLFRHTLETGEPYYTPERIEDRRDIGVTEYYEWQINRIPLPGGRDGVVCYFQDVSAQVSARMTITKSEEKYRTLFDTIDQGFIIVEVVQDAANTVIDFRYQEVNGAHEQQTGLRNVAGKLASEITPHLESYWLEPFEHVVKTGEPTRIENYNEDTGKWYQAHYSRVGSVGSRLVGVVFDEITERKRREHHAAFLDKFSQSLPLLESPDEIVRATGEALGTHLDVGFLNVVDVELDHGDDPAEARFTVTSGGERNGLTNPRTSYRAGDYLSEEFLRAARAGETVVVRDTDTDPRADAQAHRAIGMRAYVSVPILKDNTWPGLITVLTPVPRDWRPDEVTLIVEVAHRVFPLIERARAEEALRESRNKLGLALDAAELGAFVWYPQEDRTELDARMLTLLGLENADTVTLAESVATLIHPDDRAFYASAVASATDPKGDRKLDIDYRIIHPDGSICWLHIFGHTLFSDENPPRSTQMYGMVLDITKRKRSEANLAFLADVTENLILVPDIEVTMHALCEKIGKHFSASAVGFSEIDEATGTGNAMQIWNRGDVIIPTGLYSISDFHSERVQNLMRAGKPEIVPDTASFPKAVAARYAALQILAYVNIPHVRKGEWVLTLSITDNNPRDWHKDELALMTELTTRIWTRVERARAELALRKSEEHLRLATEAADIYWWEYDFKTNIPSYSSNAAQVIGAQPGITMEENHLLLHPDDREISAKAFELSKSNNDSFNYIVRSIAVPSEIRWLQVSGKIIRDKQSNPMLAVGISQNVTERVRQESNLAFLAEVSAELVNLANIDEAINALGAKIGAHFRASICSFLEIDAERGIGTIAHDWRAEDAVSLVGKYRIADYGTEEQLATWRSGNPFVLRDAKSDKRVNGEALAQYGIGSYLSIPIARDGEWSYLLTIYDRVARDWREDEIELMSELTTRIWTRIERARAEEQLALSREKYHDLFETMDQGFCIIEMLYDINQKPTDYRFIEINPMFERHSGLIDAVGKTALEMVPNLEARWFEIYGKVAQSGESIRFIEGSDAMGKWFEVHASRVGKKGAHHVALLFTDITERKHLERQKEEFIGIASHELKTPVTSIKAYAQMLHARLLKEGNTKVAEHLAKMDGQLDKLTRLISDLLDSAKIEAGKLAFDSSNFDFNQLVEEIATEVQITSARHRIVLKLGASKKIYADRERVGQVIMNLLTNAIKYSPSAKKVVVQTRSDANLITLFVQDFGIGISRKKQKHVFERFYRVDEKKHHETYGGMGLGLYISAEIVRRLGGEIWVESNAGKGATFSFSLPLSQKKLKAGVAKL